MNKNTLEGSLITDHKNILYTFMLKGGKIKGYFINATELVNKVRETHSLGVMETLILGQAHIGAALMAATLKNNESLKLKIECSGPVKGLSVEALSNGEIRGYLFQNPIPLEPHMNTFDTSPVFQAGFLSVTRFSENNKSYSGQVMLEHGRIAQDLASYYLVSEQKKTAFNLSVFFDKNGIPKGAGGIFLQALPEEKEKTDAHGDSEGEELQELLEKAESAVRTIPSIGKYFSGNSDSVGFIMNAFSTLGIEIIGSSHVNFKCRCSRERFFSFLSAMDKKEIKSILSEGPLPLKITCHNCSTDYFFDKEEIEGIV
ncbi:MAG: Hsp33 family molecular chaperone HslO [Spirochaetia bacterium]|jgi:molecular chaperone Hsp33|nr:Hsp33 family molecular chaperone HslO [Spirochaetia bacterium]